MPQRKTQFPRKNFTEDELWEMEQQQLANNDEKEEIGKDFTIDASPYDFPNFMKGDDADLSSIYDESKKRELYIYKLSNLFKQNEKPKAKFSQNVVKIGFIDIDDVLVETGYETSNFEVQLQATISANPQDNTTEYSMSDTKIIDYQGKNLFDNFQLYIVSLNEPLTNDNIDKLYIIDQYSAPIADKSVITTKMMRLIKLSDFKTRDGNPIIAKIQKPLNSNQKISSIKIKAPKTMMFGNIKVLGEHNGIVGYPKLTIDDDKKSLFPLVSVPIETQPKVSILQHWFSKLVLPWNLAQTFIKSNSVLDMINFGDILPTSPKKVFKNARITSGRFVTKGYSYGTGPPPNPWPVWEERNNKWEESKESTAILFNLIDKKLKKLKEEDHPTKDGLYITTTSLYDDVVLEFKDVSPLQSLQKVLLDMLSYTYNYYRNFEGAKYNDQNNPNPMAELKEKFQGNKPEEVISNLFEQWKLDNPKYVNNYKIEIFKQIVAMLPNSIISKQSINNGNNDDTKLLLPYYFEIESSPIKQDNGVWEFKSAEVILKSAYFDFSNASNIRIQNDEISKNTLYKLNDNQFNWMSIPNQLETNDIPSLLPSDLTLANGEYGKYLTRIVINNNNVNDWLKRFGTGNSGLFSKLEWLNFSKDIQNEFTLKFDKDLVNISRIEISGIFGNGKYELILVDNANKEIININNLELFSSIDESLSFVALEI